MIVLLVITFSIDFYFHATVDHSDITVKHEQENTHQQSPGQPQFIFIGSRCHNA